MKKLLILTMSVVSLYAQENNYSYFSKGVDSSFVGNIIAPNGETIMYISPINAIQFGGSAGSGGDVAVVYNSSNIKAWASGYTNYTVGTIENQVDDKWRVPDNIVGAITKVEPTEKVCTLGNGGSITLYFESGISNGEGVDFAVFENGFDENYLELGFVEVSSDGVNFVRFPNFYLGNDRVYEWLFMGNCDVLPTDVYNLASKYECGYGHGFDLQELVYAYEYINSANCAFSDEYIEAFLLSYATLDINNINYIRITDIYGDGTVKDTIGHSIFDPTGNQMSSPGVDLQGVAVLNTATVPEPAEWALIFAFCAFLFVLRKRNGLF